ncbi:hypothetical protein WICPIJ_000746 [Wickerhamomyces pijperi]|uniref:Glycosyltransferase family 8 protein n=1 Tax=Wickerhamomyces pijperi TaxID=599730 RepID=A0A9P8QF72_WICPI|nr:hypothetical protein WICPIJ_000746 [Wickerhamomyces pijperi]
MSFNQYIRTGLRQITTQYYRLNNQVYSSLNDRNGSSGWLLNKGALRIIVLVFIAMVTVFGFSTQYDSFAALAGTSPTTTTGTETNTVKPITGTGSGTDSASIHSGSEQMIDAFQLFESKGHANSESTNIFTDESTGSKLLDFDRTHAKYISPEIINDIYSNTDLAAVDWSRYAYVLYATSPAHLCNSFMIFSALREYGSEADMVLILNEEFLDTEGENGAKYAAEYKELMRQKDQLKLKYSPVPVVTKTDVDPGKMIWISSFTKLLVFGETQYDRIIYMDADAVLTKSHLDELFFIPPCKLASPSGYWLTQDIFNRENDQMIEKYPAEKFEWKPKTVQERAFEIWQYGASFIQPFLDQSTGKLSTVINKVVDANRASSFEENVNVKNLQNAQYNNLPNYYTLDEFLLTNIIMVIQPDEELFNIVKQGIEERSHDEFDMDIMQRLFHLPTTIKTQTASLQDENKTFQDRLNEIPEFIILPATAYGTLTSEFNIPEDHTYFAADPVDQIWATHPSIKDPLKKKLQENNSIQPPYFFVEDLTTTPAEYLNRNVKYLHFSDAPIPKPWFYFDPKDGYMGHRYRCPTFREFVFEKQFEGLVKPGRVISDCSAADVWEHGRDMFTRNRLNVCGLPLVRASGLNTYFDIIN